MIKILKNKLAIGLLLMIAKFNQNSEKWMLRM